MRESAASDWLVSLLLGPVVDGLRRAGRSSVLRLRGLRGDELQSPLDGLWDWGRRGEVVTHGHEAVLVGGVAQVDVGAVGGGVAESSLRHLGLGLGVARVLHESLLIGADLVGGLVTEARATRL